jgi:hypothetical protein
MLPPELRGDFQDLASWRQGVVEVLDLALGKHDGVVIAPMTVTNARYFEETVGRLTELGHDVRHFALLAERETVLKRLRERGFGHLLQYVAGKDAPLRHESWAVRQLDDCLERLREPEFAEHLWTDHTTVAKTADRIAVLAGLTLTPNKDGVVRGRLRRAWTGAKHIRFD